MTFVSDDTATRQVPPGGAPEDASSAPVLGLDVAHHRSFRHEALLWQDERSFLDHSVPFVRAGLLLDQAVLVATIPDRVSLLRDALGDDAHRVRFLDMEVSGANPARIIPVWREFVRSSGALAGRPVRGIGEPVWPGRRAEEVHECQLHEALLNEAVDAEVPLWLLCPYDATRLDPEVVREAGRSHPYVVDAGGPGRSDPAPAFGGNRLSHDLFARDLPADDAQRLLDRRDASAADLPTLRTEIAALAADADLPPERAADLVLAVCEVATNGIIHGGGAATCQAWRTADALVCEVRDDGLLDDPMVGRRAPGVSDTNGRGLWMANQLCDLVQVRSGQHGTTVRLFTWLDRADPPAAARTDRSGAA